jgi:autotransporter-associated beta strand protein
MPARPSIAASPLDGSGNTALNGVISNNTATTALIKQGSGDLSLAGSNTFTGGLVIKAGSVTARTSSNALGGSSTGAVALGDTTGTSAASLLVGTTGLSFANPITLATNASAGLLTIGTTSASVGSVTFTGGVSGTNHVTIDSSGTTGAVTFSSAAINNSGVVTKIGSGSGTTSISIIGTNVTGVHQNSATSATTISTLNVNSAGTTLTNTAGTKQLTITNAVTGTGNLILNNNSSLVNGITLTGGINSSGTVTNSGTGTGAISTGTIGSNVTGILQNSASSALTVSSASSTNAYTLAASTPTGSLVWTFTAAPIDVVVGSPVSGTNIASGTVVTAVDYVNKTVTVNLGPTSAITGNTPNFGTQNYSNGFLAQQGTVVLGSAHSAGTGSITLGLASSSANAALQTNGVGIGQSINLVSGSGGSANTGTLTLGTAGSSASVFTGAVALNNHALSLDGGSGTGSTRVSGIITGTSQITTDSGPSAAVTVSLADNRASFTGSWLVNTGTLNAVSSNSLGSASVVIADGATLSSVLGTNTFIGGTSITINAGSSSTITNNASGGGRTLVLGINSGSTGTLAPISLGSASTGATLNFSNSSGQPGSSITTGTVTVAASSTINTGASNLTGSFFQLGAAAGTVYGSLPSISATPGLSGSGNLTKSGTGVLTLAGDSSSTYSGQITATAGSVRLSNLNNLGSNTTALTIQSGAALDITTAIPTSTSMIVQSSGSIERWSVDGARGSTSTSYTLPSGINLQVALAQTGTRTLTLNGSGIEAFTYGNNNGGQITARNLASTITVDLAGNSFVGTQGQNLGLTTYFTATPTLGILGSITGTGSLTKRGSTDSVIIGSAGKTSSYSGGTFITAGTLGIGVNDALPTSTTLDVSAGATFDLSNFGGRSLAMNSGASAVTYTNTTTNQAGTASSASFNQTVAGLTGAGTVTNSGVSAALPTSGTPNTTSTVTNTLTLGGSGTYAFSGTLQDRTQIQNSTITTGSIAVSSTTTGIITLLKTGSGTQTLTGANTYTGPTTISGGSLILASGTGKTGTGAVTVQSGGTLLGTGSVQGSSFTAQSGSTIQAGDSTAASSYGTLHFTPVVGSGSFDFQSGSTVILGLNLGGASDLLNFVGTGTTTLLFNSNFTIGPASFSPVMAQVFNLMDWSGLSAAPTFASRFTYAGLLTGNGDEATGLNLPDVSGSGFNWDITNLTTNGSIALVAVIPEPSRALLLLLGLITLRLRRRRDA